VDPSFETLHVAAEGGRGEIILQRPEQLNPLSVQTLGELAAAAQWFDARDDVRVVVVSGAGRAFSAGADVAAFTDSSLSGSDARRSADAGRRMAEALERMQPVTIAKIRGHCVGGGVVLAAACDLRIAADDVRFSIPEIDLGIPLAWGGVPRLVREIGPALAKELIMTGRSFTSAEALVAGFLNRIVSAAELDAAVEQLAASLAAKPRQALLVTKRHVNAVTDQMVGTGRSWADADGLLAAMADPEGRQAAAEYLTSLRDPEG
jgi:enoyl-CoA hydratase/carnithine racemase